MSLEATSVSERAQRQITGNSWSKWSAAVINGGNFTCAFPALMRQKCLLLKMSISLKSSPPNYLRFLEGFRSRFLEPWCCPASQPCSPLVLGRAVATAASMIWQTCFCLLLRSKNTCYFLVQLGAHIPVREPIYFWWKCSESFRIRCTNPLNRPLSVVIWLGTRIVSSVQCYAHHLVWLFVPDHDPRAARVHPKYTQTATA